MISMKFNISVLFAASALAKTLVIKDNTVESVKDIGNSPIIVKEGIFEVDLMKDASQLANQAIKEDAVDYFRVRSEYENFMNNLSNKINSITENSFANDTDIIENSIVFNRNYHLLADTAEIFNYSLITDKYNSFTELYKIIGDLAKVVNPIHSELFVKSAFVAKAVENISSQTQNPEAVLPFISYANIYVDLLTALTGTSKVNEISYIMQILIRIEEQNKKVVSLYKSLQKEDDVYVESEISELLDNLQLVSRLATIFKSTSLNVLQDVSVKAKDCSVFLNAINLMHYFANLSSFTNCAVSFLITKPADENDLTYVSKLCNIMLDLYKNNLFFSIRKTTLAQFMYSINKPFSYLKNIFLFFLKFFSSPKFNESDVFLNCTGKYVDVYSEQLANFSADSILSFVEEFETAYSEDLKKNIASGEIEKIIAEIMPQLDEVEKRFISNTDQNVDKGDKSVPPAKSSFANLSLKTLAGVLLCAMACVFVFFYYKVSKQVEAKSIN